MAARKTPNAKKPDTVSAAQRRDAKNYGRQTSKGAQKPNSKPKDQPGGAYTYSDTTTPITGYKTPFKNDLANQGKAYLVQSYGGYAADGTPRAGGDATSAGMSAVMDYYHGLPRRERVKAYAELAKAINNRDFTNWSGPFYSALSSDLAMGAREAYGAAKGAAGGGAAVPASAAIDPNKAWTKGVSGATGEFVTEQGGQGPAGLASEATGPTKNKKRKARVKAKKLTKKAKKPGSPGGTKVTPKERRVIRKTKPNPAPRKASDRLRNRKGK